MDANFGVNMRLDVSLQVLVSPLECSHQSGIYMSEASMFPPHRWNLRTSMDKDEEEDIIPAQPPLHDQSLFTRKLFELWDRQAVFGPAHLERLLRVETWYLEGRHVKHHDEQRNVMLAEDYWTWEGILTHRWRDFVLPGH